MQAMDGRTLHLVSFFKYRLSFSRITLAWNHELGIGVSSEWLVFSFLILLFSFSLFIITSLKKCKYKQHKQKNGQYNSSSIPDSIIAVYYSMLNSSDSDIIKTPSRVLHPGARNISLEDIVWTRRTKKSYSAEAKFRRQLLVWRFLPRVPAVLAAKQY